MNSLDASTEKMQAAGTPGHESVEERLRRVVRETMAVPKQPSPMPGAAPAPRHEGPEGVLHRIMHEAMLRHSGR